MSNMIRKHSPAQHQCSCCDKGGAARRQGKKSAKAKETRAWKNEHRRGES